MNGLKRIYSYSDNGPVLNINEDDLIIDMNHHLYGVIDGHGGSGIGDKYSYEVKSLIEAGYGRLVSDPDATMPIFYDPQSSLEINGLMNIIIESNNKILELNKNQSAADMGGVSLITGVSIENYFHCVSIGNCFAVKVKRDDLFPVFLPDSNYNFSMMNYHSSGQTFPFGFLGERTDFSYQVKTIDVREGEKLILMTDGIYQRISGLEILSVCQAHNNDEDSSSLANDLVALANDRGNKDNQSLVILDY